jgi:hypothetical protein
MKFQELIFGALTEEIKNKKLLDTLILKWNDEYKEMNPGATEIPQEEVNNVYDGFLKIQGGLRPELPQVITFLNHFDGRFGRSSFDEMNLKDLTKYTYKQIKFLLGEYNEGNPVNVNVDVFSGKDTKPTPERIEASKELWTGEDNLIFSEGGLRVYEPKNQQTSIRYGYYYHTIYKQALGYPQDYPDTNISPWCVTWRFDDMGKTNLWVSYRSAQKRTFYFVIDENKNITDEYFMSALQNDPTVSSGFRITSLKNNGDTVKTWDDIAQIYPQLKNQKSLFVSVPYKEEEEAVKDEIGRINEIIGHEYEFRRQPRNKKVRFIERGGVLTKPESWQSMDEKLRNVYIIQPGLNNNSLLERFSTMNLIKEIKKVERTWKYLDKEIKKFNTRGVSYLVDKLFENEFTNIRVSIDNPSIFLYKSKRDDKVGIFDSRTFDWLELGGKTYSNKYDDMIKSGDGDVYFEESTGNVYIVEPFCHGGRNNDESDDCFYVVYPQDNPKDGHFMSNKKFMELQNILVPEEGMAQNRSDSPKDYVDIKEKWGL